MNLENLNVLVLSPGEYSHILKKVLLAAHRDYAWNISILSQIKNDTKFADITSSPEQIVVIPDFQKTQDWENDPAEVKAVEKIMHDSQKSSHIALNRILLSFERSLGRAYSKDQYYWPENKQAKRVLKNKDYAQLLLMRMFGFAYHTLREKKPNLLLAGPPGSLNLVFYVVSKHLKVPYVGCLLSNVNSDCHCWSTELECFNEKVNAEYERKLQTGENPKESTLNYLQDFRSKPEPQPFYKIKWSEKHYSLSLRKINKAIFDLCLYRLVPIVKRISVTNLKPFWSAVLDLYRCYFLSHTQQKFFHTFNDNQLAQMKYIYYCCSQAPEFVINVRATKWYNQANTIKMLSYNLPAGYQLLVREHRNNCGRRSTAYWRNIERLPNTYLVDPFDDQYKYLKNSDLIVTINGTTGFEGLLLKKRVMTLDRAFYSRLDDMVSRFDANSDLGATLLELLDSSCNHDDHKLALFIDAERDTTIEDSADPEVEINYIKGLLTNLL